MRLRSSTSASAITANWYQWICGAVLAVEHEVADRLDAHEHATADRIAASPSAPEVLRAAMAVGVPAVGRAPAEAHREEREHRRDHVAA